MTGSALVARELFAGAAVLRRLAAPRPARAIAAFAAALAECYRRGGKVLAFGNGGSAGDAQHFVTELVVRLRRDRPPLRALALTTNTLLLTAAANDYGYRAVFTRQVDAWAEPGDVVVALSTSGTSPNVVVAARLARRRGAVVVGLTGRGGGTLKPLCHLWLGVPTAETAHVQEGHLAILHAACRQVETILFPGR